MHWETASASTIPTLRAADGGAGRQAAGAGAHPTGISAIGHTRIVHDFVAAIRDLRAPLVTGEEARRALAMVLAVYESARTGRPTRPL